MAIQNWNIFILKFLYFLEKCTRCADFHYLFFLKYEAFNTFVVFIQFQIEILRFWLYNLKVITGSFDWLAKSSEILPLKSLFNPFLALVLMAITSALVSSAYCISPSSMECPAINLTLFAPPASENFFNLTENCLELIKSLNGRLTYTGCISQPNLVRRDSAFL